jgi:hypothetical protein
MTRDRPRILLCWSYERRSYVQPFEALADRFDFLFISRIDATEDRDPQTRLPRTYWGRYRSAVEILERETPDAVVFMSIASGRDIALNVAARTRGIPTYLLDHGSFAPLKELLRAYHAASHRVPRPASGGGLAAIDFVRRSLSWRNAPQAPLIGAQFVLRRFEGGFAAVRYAGGEYRRPDRFISFTPLNARFWRDVYGASDNDLDYIGIPEFDAFFAKPIDPEPGAYDLLIDTPVTNDPGGLALLTRAEMRSFYTSLAERCSRSGFRLKVKLHPYSYQAQWYPFHPALDWVRDTDIVRLVGGARHVYSFRSTLALPAIALKPVCMLDAVHKGEVDELAALRVVVPASLTEAAHNTPRFEQIEWTGPRREQFLREYLFAVDGNATERLAAALARPADLVRAARRTWPLALPSFPRHHTLPPSRR